MIEKLISKLSPPFRLVLVGLLSQIDKEDQIKVTKDIEDFIRAIDLEDWQTVKRLSDEYRIVDRFNEFTN